MTHPTPERDEPNEAELRTAKQVLFLLAFVPLCLLIVVLLVFFQPEHQVLVERHENGYPRTRTEHVAGPAGRPVRQGRHQAWHENGRLAEEGRFEADLRVGEWRFWHPTGGLDAERSGIYEDGRRVEGLRP